MVRKFSNRLGAGAVLCVALSLCWCCVGCMPADSGNDNQNDNGNDNGSSNANDNSGGDSNDNGGSSGSQDAIVKTQIIVGIGGKIDVGDDLVVYGVGDDEDETSALARFNQPAGVHYFTPSQVDNTLTGGMLVPGSDALFGHRDFEVAGKKIVLVRSTNVVSIYDTATGTLDDISIGDIELHPLAPEQDAVGHMTADGDLIATINNTGFFGGSGVTDGNAIKVIDVGGSDPVIISCPNPLDQFDDPIVEFAQVIVDADTRRVAAVGRGATNDLFVWDLNNPQVGAQTFDFGLGSQTGAIIAEHSQIRMEGNHVMFLDDADFDPQAALLNLNDGSITTFTDNPSQRDAVVAIEGGSFGYLLFREAADQETEGSSTNVFRSAIGAVRDAPFSMLASQLDTYALRSTTISTGVIDRGQCAGDDRKHVGYGASMGILEDGSRWFLAGWRSVDRLFDYVLMSTGGVFSDFEDPEGNTLTGSLMGTDIVCGENVVAFRGLRETEDSNCLTTEDWVISFIIPDRLDN